MYAILGERAFSTVLISGLVGHLFGLQYLSLVHFGKSAKDTGVRLRLKGLGLLTSFCGIDFDRPHPASSGASSLH